MAHERKLLGRKVKIVIIEGIVVEDEKDYVEIAVIRSENAMVQTGQVYRWPKVDWFWGVLEVIDVE